MKNILVIGSTGFIGKALVNRLIKEDHIVHVFNSKRDSIADQNSLAEFSDKNIDHVFHLAAKTFVPDSWEAPYDFYQVNFMGTLTVLEFCRKHSCKLTFLSSYLYGEPKYMPIDEKHPLHAYNPYALSKLLAETNCQFYSDNFSVSVCILRLFNAYGPGQPDHFLIPTILSQILDNNRETVLVKDLTPKRDYVYIDDIVDAMILSINGQPGVYNVASGHSISVEDIILILLKDTNISKGYASTDVSRKNEVFDLYGDISKIRKEFGWQPKTTLEEGLAKCLAGLTTKE